MKMTRKQEIKQIAAAAQVLGTIAFNNGKSRVPALNQELRDFMAEKNIQVGEGIPVMKAFIAGWDNTNLYGGKPFGNAN